MLAFNSPTFVVADLTLPSLFTLSLRSQVREVKAVEEQIKRRLPIGSSSQTSKLIDEFVVRQGYAQFSVMKAIKVLVARGEMAHMNQQRTIKRLR